MESSTHESPPNPNPSAHTFESPHPIYAMAVSSSSSSFPRLALGSFIEDLANRVDIVSFDAESLSFDPQISFDHPYPPTKLMFHPNSTSSLLASSGESLNIWRTVGSSVELRSSLKNRAGEFCAPLTSFDWNEAEPRRIGTSSIDTTCTVWDVEAGAVETQLIAHDKEVYDIAWGDAGVFASVSADGSVRIFDLRDKEHSTIVYESPDAAPILRLAWNRADLRYIAGVVADSSRVVVLDIRSPAVPVAELARHRGAVNAVAWGPRDPRCLCSAGDDGRALMWDLPGTTTTEGGIDPVMMYTTGAEINQLQWAAAQPEWIGIAFANKVQLLRV